MPARHARLAPLLLLLLLLPLLSACRGPAEAPRAAADPPPALHVAAPASSDAVAEVKASMHRFLDARRFHARMEVEGTHAMTSEMDYVAPDRYRIQLPAGVQTVIGDVLYMQAGGRTTQVPLPPETLAPWRDPLKLQQAQQGLSAEFLGPAQVAGMPARRYRVRHAGPGLEFEYWMGADGLPLRLRHTGSDSEGRPYQVVQTYSRYDDPSIEIPTPR